MEQLTCQSSLYDAIVSIVNVIITALLVKHQQLSIPSHLIAGRENEKQIGPEFATRNPTSNHTRTPESQPAGRAQT